MTAIPLRTATAIAATVLALTGLSGCGGDDGLTAKEFRAKADALCEAADKDTDAIGDGLVDATDEAQLTAAIDKLVDRTEKLVEDLDELEPPDDLADDVEKMLDSITAGLKKVDAATMEELNAMEDPFTEANEKAEDLGLDACAD